MSFVKRTFSITDILVATSVLILLVVTFVGATYLESDTSSDEGATGRVRSLIETHPDEVLRRELTGWLTAGTVELHRSRVNTTGEHLADTALSIDLTRRGDVWFPTLVVYDHFVHSDFADDDEQGWGAISHEYHHLRQILLLGWWHKNLLTGQVTASFAETRLECEYAAYLRQCYFHWSRGMDARHPYCDILGVEGPKGLRSQIVRDLLRLPGYEIHASYLGHIATRGPDARFASEDIAEQVFPVVPEKYSYMEITTTP